MPKTTTPPRPTTWKQHLKLVEADLLKPRRRTVSVDIPEDVYQMALGIAGVRGEAVEEWITDMILGGVRGDAEDIPGAVDKLREDLHAERAESVRVGNERAAAVLASIRGRKARRT